jgi:hypothetical protein
MCQEPTSPEPLCAEASIATTVAPCGIGMRRDKLFAAARKPSRERMTMHVDGKCLCGSLEYEAEVDPASAHICHCTDCQVLAGSAFRTTVFVTGGFRFLRGRPNTFVKVAESGNRRVLAFCPTCGTSIYSRPEDGKAGYFGLRIGSLRQRHELMPRTQCWRRSAQSWVNLVGELPASDGDELP